MWKNTNTLIFYCQHSTKLNLTSIHQCSMPYRHGIKFSLSHREYWLQSKEHYVSCKDYLHWTLAFKIFILCCKNHYYSQELMRMIRQAQLIQTADSCQERSAPKCAGRRSRLSGFRTATARNRAGFQFGILNPGSPRSLVHLPLARALHVIWKNNTLRLNSLITHSDSFSTLCPIN